MCAPVVEFVPKITSARRPPRVRFENFGSMISSFLAQAAMMTLPLVASLSQGIAGKKCKPLKQHGNRLQHCDMEKRELKFLSH